MNDRTQSNKNVLHKVQRTGIYVNQRSGNLFHGPATKNEPNCTNRIIPDNVYLDEDGYICVDVDRRKLTFAVLESDQ